MQHVDIKQAAEIITEAGFPLQKTAVTRMIQRGTIKATKEPVQAGHKTMKYIITMDELNRYIAARKLAAGMPLKELLGEVKP